MKKKDIFEEKNKVYFFSVWLLMFLMLVWIKIMFMLIIVYCDVNLF